MVVIMNFSNFEICVLLIILSVRYVGRHIRSVYVPVLASALIL